MIGIGTNWVRRLGFGLRLAVCSVKIIQSVEKCHAIQVMSMFFWVATCVWCGCCDSVLFASLQCSYLLLAVTVFHQFPHVATSMSFWLLDPSTLLSYDRVRWKRCWWFTAGCYNRVRQKRGWWFTPTCYNCVRRKGGWWFAATCYDHVRLKLSWQFTLHLL